MIEAVQSSKAAIRDEMVTEERSKHVSPHRICITLAAALLAAGVSVSGGAQQRQQPARRTVPARQPAAPEPQEEPIPPARPDALFPAVVARVNGKAILGRDLEQRIQAELSEIGSPKWTDLREDYRSQLVGESLGALIGAELLYQKAVAGGMRATEGEAKEAFDRFAKGFSSDAEMNTALAGRGLDRDGATKELRRSLTLSKFISSTVSSKITVTPAEVSEYYKSNIEEFRHPDLVRTSHILIGVPQGAGPDRERLARERAESLLARARRGEDFAKLAKENSTDASAAQGGDIGLSPLGQLVPEYEAAAFSLPVGGISEVVRSQYGFHIIKVTEKKPAGTAGIAEVKDRLTSFLKDQKTEAELEKTVDQLRLQAKIEVLLPVGVDPNAEAAAPRPSRP